MIDIANEIRKAYNGNPWHGHNIMHLLFAANPGKVFDHPIPNAHSIAELVAHLTAWTDEVTERLTGKAAKLPEQGDWPAVLGYDPASWNSMLDDFIVANEKLIAVAATCPEEKWNAPTNDPRNRELGTGVTHLELINGLLQHHAYHGGQIALLLKF